MELKILVNSTKEYYSRQVAVDTMKKLQKLEDSTNNDEATIDIVETDIKYYNKNREELEKYIYANKYNL